MESRVLILATILRVKDGHFIFPFCNVCYCKVTGKGTSQRFSCTKCQQSFDVSQLCYRYRLSATISDGSAACDVSIFGKCLEVIFGTDSARFNKILQRHINPRHPNEASRDEELLQTMTGAVVGRNFYFGFKVPAKKEKLSTLKQVLHLKNMPDGLVAFQIFTHTLGPLQPNLVEIFKRKYASGAQKPACEESDDVVTNKKSARSVCDKISCLTTDVVNGIGVGGRDFSGNEQNQCENAACNAGRCTAGAVEERGIGERDSHHREITSSQQTANLTDATHESTNSTSDFSLGMTSLEVTCTGRGSFAASRLTLECSHNCTTNLSLSQSNLVNKSYVFGKIERKKVYHHSDNVEVTHGARGGDKPSHLSKDHYHNLTTGWSSHCSQSNLANESSGLSKTEQPNLCNQSDTSAENHSSNSTHKIDRRKLENALSINHPVINHRKIERSLCRSKPPKVPRFSDKCNLPSPIINNARKSIHFISSQGKDAEVTSGQSTSKSQEATSARCCPDESEHHKSQTLETVAEDGTELRTQSSSANLHNVACESNILMTNAANTLKQLDEQIMQFSRCSYLQGSQDEVCSSDANFSPSISLHSTPSKQQTGAFRQSDTKQTQSGTTSSGTKSNTSNLSSCISAHSTPNCPSKQQTGAFRQSETERTQSGTASSGRMGKCNCSQVKIDSNTSNLSSCISAHSTPNCPTKHQTGAFRQSDGKQTQSGTALSGTRSKCNCSHVKIDSNTGNLSSCISAHSTPNCPSKQQTGALRQRETEQTQSGRASSGTKSNTSNLSSCISAHSTPNCPSKQQTGAFRQSDAKQTQSGTALSGTRGKYNGVQVIDSNTSNLSSRVSAQSMTNKHHLRQSGTDKSVLRQTGQEPVDDSGHGSESCSDGPQLSPVQNGKTALTNPANISSTAFDRADLPMSEDFELFLQNIEAQYAKAQCVNQPKDSANKRTSNGKLTCVQEETPMVQTAEQGSNNSKGVNLQLTGVTDNCQSQSESDSEKSLEKISAGKTSSDSLKGGVEDSDQSDTSAFSFSGSQELFSQSYIDYQAPEDHSTPLHTATQKHELKSRTKSILIKNVSNHGAAFLINRSRHISRTDDKNEANLIKSASHSTPLVTHDQNKPRTSRVHEHHSMSVKSGFGTPSLFSQDLISPVENQRSVRSNFLPSNSKSRKGSRYSKFKDHAANLYQSHNKSQHLSTNGKVPPALSAHFQNMTQQSSVCTSYKSYLNGTSTPDLFLDEEETSHGSVSNTTSHSGLVTDGTPDLFSPTQHSSHMDCVNDKVDLRKKLF